MDASAQIHEEPSGSNIGVYFSCVLGGWGGVGASNISADPLFVAGPQGNFYLSQVSSGQGSDSPCHNTGVGMSSNFYVSGTTRTDETDDTGTIDMGFHYNDDLQHRADTDGDGDVDGVNFAIFASCFNKAGNPPRTLGCNALNSVRFDFDNDRDVDGVDFAVFSACFNKAGNPPRTAGCPQW